MSSAGSLVALEGNEDVVRYFTTKHSWRGKYKRIFCIGTKGITTLNPVTSEVTNQWPYSDVVDFSPNLKTSNELTVTVKKGKKNNQMTFSCDHRQELITEALRFTPLFSDANRAKGEKRCKSAKYRWSETRVDVNLVIRRHCVCQVDIAGTRKLADYDYKDIEYLAKVSDHPGAFVICCGGFGRLHMFLADSRDELLKDIQNAAYTNIGCNVVTRREPITHNDFQSRRFGKYSDDDSITSLTEFQVQKHSIRHSDPAVRTLSLSETCIVERDPSTYAIVTLQPLCNVFSLIRYQENPQNFAIEYVNGHSRKYTSADRDALLCSILDGVRATGNKDVCIKMRRTKLGLRLGPLLLPVEEEVESIFLKGIASSTAGPVFYNALEEFNVNIGYSGLNHAVTQEGLFTENKEKLINQAISSLLAKEGNQASVLPVELEGQFHALRRLVASKAGYESFTSLPSFRDGVGQKVVKALKRKDDGITHACLDFLCALMQPMHDNFDLKQEQLNKSSLLSSKKFVEMLIELLRQNIAIGTGALVISALLDFFTFSLCPPYSETTPGAMFDMVLELVAGLGRHLFKLFQHPSLAIVKAAGLIMKSMIEEGSDEIAHKMQELSMAEGALPRHIHTALFTSSADNRLLTHRQLSRHLVTLWVTGNPIANSLLHRMLPLGLMQNLESDETVPEKEIDRMHVRDNLKAVQLSRKKLNVVESTLLHWRTRLRTKPNQAATTQITLRKRRKNIQSEANWDLFYYKFMLDHATSSLIWNYKTREELREALENEIRSFSVDKDLSGTSEISWNHVEFEVLYESLSEEIKIGDYYLRLLLDEKGATNFVKPQEFFNDLYHRFLLSPKPSMKAMCLQAMAIVYGQCYEEIGPFNDTTFMANKLDKCDDKEERDRLLMFIDKLIYHKKNIKLFLDANGMKMLVDLLTLAHLHTSRAYVPTQTNVIEAAKDSEDTGEKEWYFANKEKEREGPYSYKEMKELFHNGGIHQKTRCWSQGMEGWKPLELIAQMKWYLVATGIPLLNESEIACLILNMMIRMCEMYPTRDIDGAVIRPLPRAKRMLSDPSTLPHLVQLLLTFDPILIDKVVILLNNIMQDNPQLPRLFMSGAFFFILMYTGSNILPIADFLKYAHMKQAFRPDEQQQSSDIMSRSILGQLIPEAMVYFLENHGPKKFSATFLGEFDTPEAIWSSEMRRMVIEKIAAHICEFTPRLQSNTRATYQYCAMPVIQYPQLEDELFCNIYYLRHLCDTVKFPGWEIREPVKVLKDCLLEWKREVDKKPPEMSIDQAYDTLGLATGVGGHEEAKVRKAYFKLAQKYHPDKNPDGRDIFESVNKAYEFLCSKSARATAGPDPHRIVLLLKTQSILFTRCGTDLQPYKYAGYPMLIKTIERETGADDLFSKAAPILTASSEVAYHTMNVSALNSEELCRENGIPVLQAAFARCVAVLSASSKEDDMATQVCTHVCRCYRVSAQFEICREAIVEVLSIVKDICRVLYFRNLTKLNLVATQTVSAFAMDEWLQTQLLQAGVLWHVLLYLFAYDYTLEEGEVEANDDTNQQSVANNLARLSLEAMARLAGYKLVGTDQPPTPYNKTIQNILMNLLTPYVSKLLARLTTSELLKILNSNTESPYLIWDNRTRAELTKYLETQQESMIRAGECDMSFGEDFTFDVLKEELIIGEIYVRVYNEQPTYVLEDPKGFVTALLDFIGTNAQYLHSFMALTASDVDTSKQGQHATRLLYVEMALEALYNVIRANAGVEAQCIGHFKLIFSLLRLQGANKLVTLTLQVISSVTANKSCVSNIADSNVLQYLLLALHMVKSSESLVLEIFQALTSNTQVVKESIQKGALIYLLDLFCNSQNPAVRELTASLFAKMITDKLVGPRVRIVLGKFLPYIFMDAMRDSAEAAVIMFENTQENPELIWNDDAREKVSDTVHTMTLKFFIEQKENPDTSWKLPENFEVVYTQVQGEVEVGGVFLRLFIQQPNWVLRKPKEFLIAILEKFGQIIQSHSPNGEILETVTQAIVCLFTAQPSMADQVPPLGHLPVFFDRLQADNDIIPKACMEVINVLSSSEFCVRNISKTSVAKPLIIGMKRRPDCVHVAVEAIHKMMEKGSPEIVLQSLQAGLVKYLITLLESSLTEVEKPSATKAIIAETLKLMAKDLACGDNVNEILNNSKIWAAYKDQKHDLFITDSNVAGYLTAGMGGVAGYITAGTGLSTGGSLSSPPPLLVPPVDIEDNNTED